MENNVRLFLSRRNLQTLINKLDGVKEGNPSKCTIIKYDGSHPRYPMTSDGEGVLSSVMITAVEDEDYYTDRKPGVVREGDI